MGPNLVRLLKNYWDQHRIVPKSGKFLGKAFRTGRGVTQGNPAYPMIFNIMVDAVVRAVLDVVYGPHEVQHGLGWAAGERNLVFYADDGRISGRDYQWVHYALALMVAMFCRIGLETNLKKIKSMVCTPGFI